MLRPLVRLALFSVTQFEVWKEFEEIWVYVIESESYPEIGGRRNNDVGKRFQILEVGG